MNGIKFNEQNKRFEEQHNELRGEINVVNDKVTKSQKNFDDKLNKMNTKLIQQLDKLARNIKNNEGTDNKVSDDCKTSGNYDGEIITNKMVVV